MIYSHPERLLTDHLQSVEKKMIEFLEDQKIDTQKAFDLDHDAFKVLIHAIAISHDLGKATKRFQSRLFGSNLKSPHSEISAIYAYAAAKHSLLLQKLNEEKAKEFSFYAFLVVRRHHGFLKKYVDEIVDLEYENDKFVKMTKNIDKDFSKWFEEQTGIEVSTENTQKTLEDLSKIDLMIENILRSKNDLSSYFTINFLYSLLVDADRIDAATYGKRPSKRIDFNTKIVQRYMKENFNSSNSFMDLLRKEVHEDVLKQDICLKDHFYTITVPTGGGKTFTSFDFAMKIREEVKKIEGRLPRIIYALPFTSLIDQNANRIKEVLSVDRKVSTDLLLVQHHLTPNEYIDEEGPLNEDLSSLLISGWHSEIIITTFVSLFEGLISNRRSDIRKLHTILGSVIILDEVQNIPHEYWKVLSEIFNFMAKNFGNYFILTTATKPQMFIESKELAKKKFELNRIKIVNESDKVNTLDDLYDQVVRSLDDSKKVLVILNTISSSQKFFKMFSDLKIKKSYLSAGVIPKIRKKVMDEINQGDVNLLVSTQVVEAGMDINFDVVYRDMAPVDSIIQSCGRCNRNYENHLGIVHLVDLKDENGLSYSKIYDDLLIGISRDIFKGKSEISEKEIQENLIEPYFEKVGKNVAQCERYLESLKNLVYFSKNKASTDLLISNFSIIKGFLKAIVYIQYDEQAIDLWNEFEQIKSLDPKEWYIRATTLFKKMNQYMISINITRALIENGPPIIDNQRGNSLYFVSKDQLYNFYDEEIGFQISQSDVMIM